MWPLFGIFNFDLYGYTAYAYSLAMLFVVFLGARRLVNSPFGLSLRGIRENWVRMPAIGAPSRAHLRTVYTIAATIAGIAGGLLAQTTRVRLAGSAQLPTLRRRAGDPGARRHRAALWRGCRRHRSSWWRATSSPASTPQYWYFWIGLMLIAVVMFLPNGILGGLASALRAWRDDGGQSAIEHAALCHPRPAQELRLARRCARHRDHPAARRALRADRPERRRQDHADQPDHRHAAPDAGQILLGDEDITALDPEQRVQARARAHVPDQHAVSRPQRARSGDARGLRTARPSPAVWWRRSPPTARRSTRPTRSCAR